MTLLTGRVHVAETAAELLRKTGIFKLTERGEMTVKVWRCKLKPVLKPPDGSA